MNDTLKANLKSLLVDIRRSAGDADHLLGIAEDTCEDSWVIEVVRNARGDLESIAGSLDDLIYGV